MEEVKKLKRPKRLRRYLNSRKILKLTEELKNLEQRLIKKGVIDQTFLNFVRDIEPNEKQIEAWRKILNRKDLTPSDLYEISKVIEDKPLRTTAQRKYVAIASDNDLDDTIKYEEKILQEIAWQERCERIKKGFIKKHRAREILIDLFRNTPDYRIKIWDVLEWLGPADEELKSLLVLPFMDKSEYGELRGRIERLIRRKTKKSDNIKLLSKIRNIQEKLAKLKTGQ